MIRGTYCRAIHERVPAEEVKQWLQTVRRVAAVALMKQLSPYRVRDKRFVWEVSKP